MVCGATLASKETYIYMCVCVYIYTCMHTHTHTHTHTHVYIHTYTHTHAYTHTHTQVSEREERGGGGTARRARKRVGSSLLLPSRRLRQHVHYPEGHTPPLINVFSIVSSSSLPAPSPTCALPRRSYASSY